MKSYFKLSIIFLFIGLLISPVTFSQMIIGKDFTYEKLEDYTSGYKSDNQLPPSLENCKILQQFENIKNIAFEGENTSYFIRFSLKNTSNQPKELFLGASRFHEITLFKDTSKIATGGLNQKIEDRAINYETSSQLPIQLLANEEATFYALLKINSFGPFEYAPAPLSISDANWLKEKGSNGRFFMLFFLGGIVLMTLYNLALYIQIKKKHYLYFVLHNVLILFFVLIQSGWVESLTFGNYIHHENLILISGNLAMITYLLFASSVLDFKTYSPKFHRFITNFIWIWPLFLIPIFFGFQLVSFAIGSILSLAVYNLVLWQTIKAIKRGSISAKFYLAGNIFLYAGTTISILMINEVIPSEILNMTALEFVELGNMFELTLFALTLGAVIQEMQEKISKVELQKELAVETGNFKDKFLANMSHEIRTPLNGIIGMLDVFNVSHELSKKQQEQLGIVQTSADSLLTIINDILDLSKLQAGQMTISPTTVKTQDLVKNTFGLYAHAAKRKGITLLVEIDGDLEEYISIDQVRVKQILNNLVSNAIKFTEEGKVIIRLKKEENRLRFEVSDTGIGISPKEQEKIFENFTQGIEANKTRSDGTGLGLAICKQLAELMGGQIGIESELGIGSTFFFTILYSSSAEPQNTPEKITSRKQMALSIMVVEDKPVNQKVIQLMLQKLGHKVTLANNGIQALAKFEENKYQIIFMDVQMPEMDGVEATQQLKLKYKNLPPIIGLSANNMEGDNEKYINLGFDDYLAKPVKLSELEEKITSHIK